MTQAEALDILKTGANVFLTGEPGAGKTHTINRFVEYLHSCGLEPAITASTGIAATHINGMTIHSWSGIGVKSKVTAQDIESILEKERVVKRVLNTQTLIIDEISMLSADTLASVDAVLRAVRRKAEPFGGLQVIFVGDFFQLPPIQKRGGMEETMSFMPQENAEFAFEGEAWRAANPIVCYLSEQHRQEDGVYLGILKAIRLGKVTDETRDFLSDRALPPEKTEDLTKLFPHNADVDRINNAELEKLDGDIHHFRMQSRGAPMLIEALQRNCLSPELLSLKIGAKVMFTKNSPDGAYVNGTTGEIVEFSKTNGYPVVKTRKGKRIEAEVMEWSIQDGTKILAKIMQIPLRLAWAITVHKSQGMSLDAAHIDLAQAFEYGQGYVALSRIRTLSGLHLSGFNERALQVHPKILKQDDRFRELSDSAHRIFADMDRSELQEMHEKFIRACGGNFDGAFAPKKIVKKKKQVSTHQTTQELVSQKLSIKEIAEARGVTEGTIMSHLEKLVEEKKISISELAHLRPEQARFEKIKSALDKVFAKEGKFRLTPAREMLGNDFDFEEIRLARIFLA